MHKAKQLLLTAALAGGTALLLFHPQGSAAGTQHVAKAIPPPPGDLKLNEVFHDAIGADDGLEWIELAQVGGKAMSLGGYRLEDEAGTPLYTFPTTQLGSGWTALVFLGPVRPAIAAKDFSASKLKVFFTGVDLGNQLGDASGGVLLRRPSGALADAMFYGPSGPPTGAAGYQEAIASSHWESGDFFDTSFDGPSPNFWGGSVARNKIAKDTDRASDWSGDGGAVGALRSPGQPNTVDVFNLNLLIQRAHEVVNGAFFAYGLTAYELGRFAVSNSSVQNVVLNDLPGLAYSVTADYSFDVTDQEYGSTSQPWSGSIQVDFEKAGARVYRVTTTGILLDPAGNSLSVDHTETRSGFGTGTHVNAQTCDWELYLYGVSYPMVVTSDTTETLLSDDLLQIDADRVETSWDNQGPKSYSLSLTRQRTAEDEYDEDWTMVTPDPVTPTYLGANTPVIGTMQITASGTRSAVDGDGGFAASIDSMQIHRNGLLHAEIQGTSPGSMSNTRTGGVLGDTVGTHVQTVSFPLLLADSSGWVDPDQEPLVWSFQGDTAASEQSGKLATTGASAYSLNGWLWSSSTRYIDPPLRQVTIGPTPQVDVEHTFYGGGTGSGSGPDWDGGTAAGVGAAGACVAACVWLFPTGVGSVVSAGVCGIAAILATEY